jgi:hypothetical protein
MSLNYDACNIIAAEASQLAHDKLDPRQAGQQSLFVFDDTRGMEPQVLLTQNIARITPLNGRSYPYTNGDIQLVLAASHQSGLSGGDRSDPRLLAIVRDDLAVPVATFARRKGGQCSYVQLGQEMSDQNFIVTPYDKRKEIVDIIRSILTGGKPKLEAKPLAKLVEAEMQSQTEAIKPQLEPAVCRLAQQTYWGAVKASAPLWKLTENGPMLQMTQTARFPRSEARLPDGRYVELLLAGKQTDKPQRRVQQTDEIQLLAVTRGNIALPLVRFSEGRMTDINSGEQVDDNSIELIREAMLEKPHEWLATLQSAERQYSPQKLSRAIHNAARKNLKKKPEKEKAAATAKAVMEVFDPENAYLVEDVSSVTDHRSEFASTKSRTVLLADRDLEVDRNARVVDTDFSYYYGGNSRRLKKQIGYLKDIAIARHNIGLDLLTARGASNVLAALSADKAFEAHLGEYNPVAEKLLSDLGALARRGTKFDGRVARARIREDEGDVDLSATIEMVDGQTFHVSINGRPSALTDFEPSVIFDENLSKTEKLTLPPDDIDEMRRLIGTLGLRQK